MRRQFPEVELAEGDRVVLRTEMQELLGLKDSNKVTLVDRVSSKSTTTVEALILPECRFVGRSLGSLRLRRRYGVYPLAVHRRSQNIGRKLDEVVVRVGDTLLLEGAPDDIRRLAADMDLIDLSETTDKPFKRGRAPLVLAVLAAIVIGSAIEAAPIQILAMLGAIDAAGDADDRAGGGLQHGQRRAPGADPRHAGGGRGDGPLRRGADDRGRDLADAWRRCRRSACSSCSTS